MTQHRSQLQETPTVNHYQSNGCSSESQRDPQLRAAILAVLPARSRSEVAWRVHRRRGVVFAELRRLIGEGTIVHDRDGVRIGPSDIDSVHRVPMQQLEGSPVPPSGELGGNVLTSGGAT